MRVKHLSLLGWAAVLTLAFALMLAVGCGLPSTQPPILVKKWALEYPPPQPGGASLPAELKLKRFQAAQAYQGSDMIFSSAPNERESYHYNRWLASPSDLVGDMLLRDLRAQGGLAGVLSSRQFQRPRFVLEGGLEEFLEKDADGAWQASLKVTLTLFDTKQDNAVSRLLWQRAYSQSAPMASKDPSGLAKAMSQAVAKFSARARADILAAIEEALKKPLPQGSGG